MQMMAFGHTNPQKKNSSDPVDVLHQPIDRKRKQK
jgi:hypothetical protein